MNQRILQNVAPRATALLAWLCVLCFPQLLFSQTPTPSYPPNRYLLVVETSRAMQRRADALSQTISNLVTSSIAGQARRGDTLGIWTFNEAIHTGQVPLQQWSPDNPKALSDRVVTFLKKQTYEKAARFDALVPALQRVVRGSPFITIILVCSGETDIHGTPFDTRINEFFRTWRLQPQDSGSPFVIGLRGQAGILADCSMNPFPWPAELPELPKELLVPIPAAQPAAIDTPKPATSVVPNLIVSGKKRQTAATSPAAPTEGTATQTTSALAQAAPPQLPATSSSAPLPPPATSQVPDNSAPASPPASNLLPSGNRPPTPITSATPAAVVEPTAPAAGTTPLTVQQQPAPKRTESNSPPASASQPPQLATAIAVKAPGNHILLIATGVLSMAAVAGAILLWRRGRAHPGKETSLITESIDRRKP